MKQNGIKTEKYEMLKKHIKKSHDPIAQANKIIKHALESIKKTATEKCGAFKKLIKETKESKEYFPLPQQSTVAQLDKIEWEHKSNPVKFITDINTLSPFIHEYAGNNAEIVHLESKLQTALKNSSIEEKKRILFITTLTQANEQQEPLRKLKILRELHRTFILKKIRTQSTSPRPVCFSPDPAQERSFSAPAYELKDMHGTKNRWFQNKLKRGPSPHDLKEELEMTEQES